MSTERSLKDIKGMNSMTNVIILAAKATVSQTTELTTLN
jgi:hypothetical protein